MHEPKENQILQLRDRLRRDLDSTLIIADEHFEEVSPCGRYQLEMNAYGIAEVPTQPVKAVAIVRLKATGEIVTTVMRNSWDLIHAWITRDNHDYLLYAEDYAGQTVIDLTERIVAGYSVEGASFVWAEFYPSPDKMRLAILGCYWGCPYQVTVYDFRDPLSLPLPVLAEIHLPEDDSDFRTWTSVSSLEIVDKDGTVHTFEI